MTPRGLFLALALTVPFLVGCSPGAKLHGKWDMETEETEPPPTGGAYIPSAVAGFMKPKLNLEFQHDGDFVVEARMAGESATSRGKWSLVKTEGDVTVLKIAMAGMDEREVSVRFIDNKTIETLLPPLGDDDSWSETTAKFIKRPF